MITVQLSFDRARAAGFASRFYDRLLATNPSIRAKFARTDFDKQTDLLVHGVYSMLDYARGGAMGRMAIERLCKTHGPGHLAIQPSMYSIWMRCFLAALSEVDPEFGPELERKWKQALAPGLERLQECGRGRVPERAAS